MFDLCEKMVFQLLAGKAFVLFAICPKWRLMYNFVGLTFGVCCQEESVCSLSHPSRRVDVVSPCWHHIEVVLYIQLCRILTVCIHSDSLSPLSKPHQVKNPFGKVMLSRHYSAEGRFTFTSHDSGEHTICIGTNTTRWFGGNKLVRQPALSLSCSLSLPPPPPPLSPSPTSECI